MSWIRNTAQINDQFNQTQATFRICVPNADPDLEAKQTQILKNRTKTNTTCTVAQ
jgi:hypothetical protein